MRIKLMRFLGGILSIGFLVFGVALLTIFHDDWLTALNGVTFLGLGVLLAKYALKGNQKA
jgi:hypothetical protein